jgi:peptide-methionine (S)-S-oxide reductase
MVTYVLAGGCFWCLDAVFRELKGVALSECGYTGGSRLTASYYPVASGMTHHAESVRVTFDESIIPADTLLDIFFLIHDPTTKNRQGADVGPQYRSAMFYEDDIQRRAFTTALARAQSKWDHPIVTEITALGTFYLAEPEHQNYYATHLDAGYCTVVISPKLRKARQHYRQYFMT